MTRVGYWDSEFVPPSHSYIEPGAAWIEDDLKFSATLDVQSLVSDFIKGMREKGDAVLEPIVVDWLRGRGWIVER
jgi:hypothetical protein